VLSGLQQWLLNKTLRHSKNQTFTVMAVCFLDGLQRWLFDWMLTPYAKTVTAVAVWFVCTAGTVLLDTPSKTQTLTTVAERSESDTFTAVAV